MKTTAEHKKEFSGGWHEDRLFELLADFAELEERLASAVVLTNRNELAKQEAWRERDEIKAELKIARAEKLIAFVRELETSTLDVIDDDERKWWHRKARDLLAEIEGGK